MRAITILGFMLIADAIGRTSTPPYLWSSEVTGFLVWVFVIALVVYVIEFIVNVGKE